MHIQLLTAAEFPALIPDLSRLLQATVAAGASIGFMHPLDDSAASAYWQGVGQAIAAKETLLWLARDGEQVIGTVQLGLCLRANGLNRAEVQKLMVAPNARRAGVAAQLMQALETQAEQLQRGCLHLDTEQDSPAELFYQRQGYQRVGVIPEFAYSPTGTLKGTAIYFKLLQIQAQA
ncbi:MAG: GNAT family N-acetyltransferase [Burkholderiales bacterium]|nr:GNAT family N-acetyltransferase [Burkholderiales bacterium]